MANLSTINLRTRPPNHDRSRSRANVVGGNGSAPDHLSGASLASDGRRCAIRWHSRAPSQSRSSAALAGHAAPLPGLWRWKANPGPPVKRVGLRRAYELGFHLSVDWSSVGAPTASSRSPTRRLSRPWHHRRSLLKPTPGRLRTASQRSRSSRAVRPVAENGCSSG